MEIIKEILIIILKVHKRLVSPLLDTVFGKGCIFTPTCSEYAIESIRKHEIWRGVILSLKRLSKCRPGIFPAYDPVPEGI